MYLVTCFEHSVTDQLVQGHIRFIIGIESIKSFDTPTSTAVLPTLLTCTYVYV